MHDKTAFSRYVSRSLHPGAERRFFMRTTSCLTLLAALAVPTLAEANCYSVYDAQNRLSFQTAVAPIDLSRPISEAMRVRFPGGFLVMIPDDTDCREFRSSGIQQRFDAVGAVPGSATPAEQALQASPLLRGTRTNSLIETGVQGTRGDNDIATREAVRSGTSLNVKRAPRP